MDTLTRVTHPLSSFDLTSIGIVLVVVMIILGVRRVFRTRTKRTSNSAFAKTDFDPKDMP
ncbi:MAG: hypothetical protein MI753_08505 [Hyphomicrobiales bacterium]|nr:hypothetical protein [Hyphomicrobiales bacterium]